MANIDARRDAWVELQRRFQAAGSPGGVFRFTQRRVHGGENWWMLYCTNAQGDRIPGIQSVRYRPLITDSGAVVHEGE